MVKGLAFGHVLRKWACEASLPELSIQITGWRYLRGDNKSRNISIKKKFQYCKVEYLINP